jgi:hypothetical protein
MIDTTYAPRLSEDLQANEVLDTEIGTIYFYDSILVMEAKEDVLISIKTGLSILLDVVKRVGLKPVVYISNRVNSYSVDPNDYKFLNMIPNLKGIAIVSYSEINFQTVDLEKSFIKKPCESFNNLLEAKEWANEVLGKRAYEI